MPNVAIALSKGAGLSLFFFFTLNPRIIAGIPANTLKQVTIESIPRIKDPIAIKNTIF